MICFGVNILVELRNHVNVNGKQKELKWRCFRRHLWHLGDILLLDVSPGTIVGASVSWEVPQLSPLWGWGFWASEKLKLPQLAEVESSVFFLSQCVSWNVLWGFLSLKMSVTFPSSTRNISWACSVWPVGGELNQWRTFQWVVPSRSCGLTRA